MSTLDDMDPNALAMLTDEERAAIGDEYTPDELAAMATIAGDAKPDEGDDEGTDEGTDEGDDTDPASKADPVTKVDPDPQTTGADADPAVEADTQPITPPSRSSATRYEAALPEDFDDQVSALGTREAELKTQFRDGEIDFEQYEVGRDALMAERETLTIARAKAEISKEITAQSAASQWQSEVDRFMDSTATPDGMDYRNDKDKAADLDQFLKVLAARESNADKSMEWFLTEAHKRVKALYGVADKPAAKTEPAAEAKPAGKTAAQVNADRKPVLDNAPKTLAQVPGATGADEFEGEFTALDAMEGEDLEAAIAKMSPAQRARYAKA